MLCQPKTDDEVAQLLEMEVLRHGGKMNCSDPQRLTGGPCIGIDNLNLVDGARDFNQHRA